MSDVVYVFDCPYHGREGNVLCFRAFEQKNRGRWKKFQIEEKEVPLSDEELNAVFALATAVHK